MLEVNQNIAVAVKPVYVSRPLQNNDEVRMAKRLLYQVYVEEMGWIPQKENPSGIRFKNWQGEMLFADNFDRTAIWFGTFHHDNLIACWRFCPPYQGKFELELYHSIPTFLKTTNSLEVNRLAIHKNYRNRSRIIYGLIREAYETLHQDFDYTFAAITFPHPGDLYLKIGLEKLDVPPFKYSPSDLQEVSLIYLDFKDQTTLASGKLDARRKSA